MDLSEKIGQLYGQIMDEIGLYDDYISDKQKQYINEYYQIAQLVPKETKHFMAQSLFQLIDPSKKYTAIWLYSSSIAVSYESKIFEGFLQYVIDLKEISANTRYFIYYQLKGIMFRQIVLETYHAKLLRWKLLESVIFEFRKELKELLSPIPSEFRNEKFALVITEQILGSAHGPTKIALDRSKILKQVMGKNVLLINTAEVLPLRGEVPFLNSYVGNYDANRTVMDRITWKGTEIPYFQCEDNMPNIADLRSLLQMVRRMRPGLVISVGGSSIVANVINDIVPVLTVGLSPSDLEPTMTKCQTLSRSLSEGDKKLLKDMGLEETSVIEGIFTSSLKAKSKNVSRKEMGLPEDKFIIVVVGYRLDTDIDQGFAEVLKRVACDDIYIAFIGNFSLYDRFVEDNPELKDCLKVLGLTDDILAWVDNCDLYVNPHRKGGGTSGVEAVSLGIPVVTTPYGDVAVNVGKEFWVESYEEMPELILRYKDDPGFYQKMSDKARKRSEILLDTETEFVRILDEFRKRCEK